VKLDHLFEQHRDKKTRACQRAGCGLLSSLHPSRLEAKFDEVVEACGLGVDAGMVSEYEFATRIDRKWRADRAWPDVRVMVELDGGSFMAKGGHTSRVDRGRDNFAALDGWLVLRFDERYVDAGLAHRHLAAALMIRYKGASMRSAITPMMFPPPAGLKLLVQSRRGKRSK
jgi:hypothetical protein